MNDTDQTDRPMPIADDRSYSEAVMPSPSDNLPAVDEVIQSMRGHSLSDIRKALEKLRKKDAEAYRAISRFYAGL